MRKNNIFITKDESAQYFECGYSCDNAIALVIDESQKYFLTDSRYILEARQSAKACVETICTQALLSSLVELLQKLKIKSVLLDSAISVEEYFYLQECGIKPILESNFHQKLRILKQNDEIKKIAHSQALNKQAFEKMAKYLQENYENLRNQSELSLNYMAKTFLSDYGKYPLSFESIFAFDENAAKPHATPSDKSINQKDLILFDAGIKFERYCSDMTRTADMNKNISFSKKQRFSNPKHQKIYDIVLKAQENAIEHARSGMSAKEVDMLARSVIEDAGYGKYFTHSTGHGVGLDIHELPMVSPRSSDVIEDGMVFSIEPGIYLDNEFGVRIEDLVVMKDGKAEIL